MKGFHFSLRTICSSWSLVAHASHCLDFRYVVSDKRTSSEIVLGLRREEVLLGGPDVPLNSSMLISLEYCSYVNHFLEIQSDGACGFNQSLHTESDIILPCITRFDIHLQALPLYLDKLFNQYVAIILSVTLVLSFGEIIPQSICTRYGLAVGANFVMLVRILMIVTYPISYPIGKMLDCLLGHNEALFRRAQLKALVSIHGQEAGKGGELTHDETTIISGALDLTEKTAQEAMTPIESTFCLDVDSKLDWEAMGKILALGHSRVPVYSGSPKNIVGLILVKTLLTIRPETETPVSAVAIRKIPRVQADMPLYDILNEFQKGHSHIAAVVKAKAKIVNNLPIIVDKSNQLKITDVQCDLTTPLVSKKDDPSENMQDFGKTSKESNNTEDIQEGQVIGIITLEDVFEELLQEEIVDETDEFIDVHKRIRVAAVTAASLVARAPSLRKLTSQKTITQGGQSRHGQSAKKPSEIAASSK